MKVVRAHEAAELSGRTVVDQSGVVPHWLEGPFNGDRLDVAVVSVSPGAVTPPHTHLGGQVIVVTAGRGFVETNGARVEVGDGDVVICPPGELHTHGAFPDGPLSHLTVTTGGYSFPDQGNDEL
jgi:quercetin dioxygenase-like cupin family protein